MEYQIRILPEDLSVPAKAGITLLELLRAWGLALDTPCGGNGTCGKCTVLANGREVPACRTRINEDMTLILPRHRQMQMLTWGTSAPVTADGTGQYCIAFDVGTTTVAAWLLDGKLGKTLAHESCLNPQSAWGADVISRIQYELEHRDGVLTVRIRDALNSLARALLARVGESADRVDTVALAGNTAMHHLLLGIDPAPLTIPPYMPAVRQPLELMGETILSCCPKSEIRVLPNIAGFVGADTIGCMVASRFDRAEGLTLLIDIGTNGEMVLGDGTRMVACSTAAGPAFEGALIQCGMRGTEGAVDHVWLEEGRIRWHVIGEGKPLGLCGSGLLDLTAVLLKSGIIDDTGRLLTEGPYRLGDTDVVLTQKDIRQIQLAKAAIRAGIGLLCAHLGREPEQIRQVLLAGAFGTYMNPASAGAIGMIPPVLEDRVRPIGNAAGAGACACALSREEFRYAASLAERTEFLELASLPEFNECYIDCLGFGEE